MPQDFPPKRPAICVFCGSSRGADPAYAAGARQLGRLIAGHGFDLVFGGGAIGLMDEVAASAHEAGASVTGVLPDFLHRRVGPSRHVTQIVMTGSMHERKARMFELSDGFIALPGGIGTFEETVEMLTWAQLELHAKPIVLVNIDGYWDPFLAMLDKMIVEGFIEKSLLTMLRVAPTPEDAIEELISLAGPI